MFINYFLTKQERNCIFFVFHLLKIRPEYEVYGVEFQPVSQWFVDEENSVSYKLSGDARSTGGDWIGLFQEGFSSLDDYLVYEYVGHGKCENRVFVIFSSID